MKKSGKVVRDIWFFFLAWKTQKRCRLFNLFCKNVSFDRILIEFNFEKNCGNFSFFIVIVISYRYRITIHANDRDAKYFGCRNYLTVSCCNALLFLTLQPKWIQYINYLIILLARECILLSLVKQIEIFAFVGSSIRSDGWLGLCAFLILFQRAIIYFRHFFFYSFCGLQFCAKISFHFHLFCIHLNFRRHDSGRMIMRWYFHAQIVCSWCLLLLWSSIFVANLQWLSFYSESRNMRNV